MIKPKIKKCISCGNDRPIFSKGRCKACANADYVKASIEKRKAKGVKYPIKKLKQKTIDSIAADNRFYKLLWDSRPHRCEECNKDLGSVLNKSFISHILSKGSHPEMRHDERNVSVLCFDCHFRYEFQDRHNMKIWPICQSIIEMLKQEYYNPMGNVVN